MTNSQLIRYYGAYSNVSRRKRKKEKVEEEPAEVTEVPPPLVSKELKKHWSYFIKKVYETDPLVCPKCSGEMRISFIDQRDVIRKILEHLGLWEEAHAPLDRGPTQKEITFDSSYVSINSPSRGRSRDSQLI